MRNPVHAYLETVKHLPPCPSVMVKLVELLRKPDRDIDELVGLMSHDPVLTGEILHRCHKAILGCSEPATDLFEATFRLGFHEVYRIASALYASALIQSSTHGENRQFLEDLREHSVLTACCAAALASHLQEQEGLLYTTALLHDIGKVVMTCGDSASTAQRPLDLRRSQAAEKARFNFDHGELGGCLLARWGLPEEIVVPVTFHHEPEAAGPFHRHAVLLSTANHLAHRLREGAIPSTGPEPSPLSGNALELGEEAIVSILEDARKRAEPSLTLLPA